MKKQFDFLIIGSGIAGLFYALKASKYGKVAIISKEDIYNTTTVKAQGGIASVMYNPDSYDKHIEDTINAGAGLNNREVVEIVVKEGPTRILDLINIGTHFDKDEDGSFDLGKEGGHSENRVLHFKDKTGQEIQRALIHEVMQDPNIFIFENHFAIEIITQHHLGQTLKKSSPNIECYGAYIFDTKSKEVFTFLSKTTMIATGGCGNAYQNTTNPVGITGDGIAMVYRAKGLIENMEFVQFHPTALYNPAERPSFLITEALRGAGAILKNHKNEDFCLKYDSRGSLAPRDIVARAIDTEMKLSGEDHVYLDARHIDKEKLITHFPTIYAKCMEIGINISKDLIPVTPAAHYLCGGIKTDVHARTSIKNLYATGEAASTGLHGANRLASNSLLEAVVFAHRAAEDITDTQWYSQEVFNKIPEWNDEGTIKNEELVLISFSRKEVQQIMSNYVGIVRSDLRLQRAMDRLNVIFKETEDLYKASKVSVDICELRNIINVGYLIIKQAKERRESIGLHYNSDLA
ncbi:MAG: L-aspartate oxidase [Bacteroidales bacterium]|jgi:L-aspartate oxidase|nr:L-aspartate oxidase [Bacteroidales bacterium]MCK9500036.1 L-aspartate oxidase [Bacteroidales bacterium]MDY0313597.1 L-aspartate oxidase [Bacteroidales bacterium]NLB86924.1 L-aspartate oxidase [Bacteroidales bacterium]NLB87063.1 L-aspartate oxidase [Bacteroidales bacterium]